jgi:hypothetical protein
MTIWNEHMIARAISLQTLARKCVVLVDNCNWTGHECDVLGVTTDLRIIDVEVKISRGDLKADAKKDKWWKSLTWNEKMAAGRVPENRELWDHRDPVEHPRKVWKHYYALPKDIWKPDLLEFLPSKASGVLLVSDRNGLIEVCCARRATPNNDAYRLTPQNVMDIARLANLRMWESYKSAEMARQDANHWRQQVGEAA